MKHLLLLAAFASTGCWSENAQLGDGELFRVHTKTGALAQFVKGPMPGTPPPTGTESPPRGTSRADGGPEPLVLPEVTRLEGPRSPTQGSSLVSYQGRATEPTVSWGIALEGVSGGYWVLPVDDPDPQEPGHYFVNALLDFDRAIPSGLYRFLLLGIDADNRSGPIRATSSRCIASNVPDGLSGCLHNSKSVPEAVISLQWDANVDLDLQIRTPQGRLVEPKHPTELEPNDAGLIPPGSAQIDRDSNASCLDGVRTENLIWSADDAPPDGLYTVYANLFDACRQPSVRFTVTAYRKAPGYADGGDLHLQPLGHASGELLDFQANGGAGIGLFVTQVKF